MSWYRRIPWLMVLLVLKVFLEHYSRLSEEDRRFLGATLKDSKGRPSRVDQQQREELVRIAGEVNRAKLGKDLLGVAMPGWKKRLKK